MLFGRNRQVKAETVVLPEGLQDPRDLDPREVSRDAADEAGAEADAAAGGGPFDVSERPDAKGHIDLGSLRIPATQGLKMRLDLEESTQRIIAVTLTLGSSSMQVQAFAAPRSAGLWDEVRGEIAQSVGKTPDAQAGEKEGPFGTEVLARIPAKTPDGSAGWRVARFVGVDGPRWLLRAVIGGEAAFKEDAAAELTDVFSRLVVNRGNAPLPPRDLLPLRAPEGLRPVRSPRRGETGQPEPEDQDGPPSDERKRQPPQRGPEITEVG